MRDTEFAPGFTRRLHQYVVEERPHGLRVLDLDRSENGKRKARDHYSGSQ